MLHVCLYFQVHQPYRLRPYSVFDHQPNYYDTQRNREILERVSNKCYMPTTGLLRELIQQTQGAFKVTFSLTGLIIEQLRHHEPEVLDEFRKLIQTRQCEILAETYHHSLASIYNHEEFEQQVDLHTQLIRDTFDITPTVFRNTELVYDNALAKHIEQLGRFKGILAEGVDHVLNERSPNHVYRAAGTQLPVLLRNYRLSDDIAFRFCDQRWPGWPLTAEKFADSLASLETDEQNIVNLFMDFETFGEHQWPETGIFEFLANLPSTLLERGIQLVTPSEAFDQLPATDEYDSPIITSWADHEKDLSAWVSNAMQSSALQDLYDLGHDIKQANDPELLDDWRKLTASDHFYYMCTKYFSDGAVHKYFNPYESPYDSYINFMNVLDNLHLRAGKAWPRNNNRSIMPCEPVNS